MNKLVKELNPIFVPFQSIGVAGSAVSPARELDQDIFFS
jgi:hypothetical protein